MSTPKYAVTIRMAPEDFTTLVQDGGPLSSIPAGERGRFTEKPSRLWKYIWWLGGQYVSVLLARSYLEAIGEDYQIAYDESEWDNGRALGWVIFTDYQDEGRS